MPPEVMEALALGSLAAAQRLVELVASGDESIALKASEAVLSRLYGRPAVMGDEEVAAQIGEAAQALVRLAREGGTWEETRSDPEPAEDEE